jgi:hypothetical protein
VEPSWEIERRHRELQRHSRRYRVIRDGKYKAREIRLRYREIKGKYREIKENFLCRNISSRSRKIFVLKNQSFNAPEWKNKWDSKG